jgi:hypothetical protein
LCVVPVFSNGFCQDVVKGENPHFAVLQQTLI